MFGDEKSGKFPLKNHKLIHKSTVDTEKLI